MRPSQLATLLLASGESLPRQRARDQHADLAGSQLKQRVLQRIIELDPEADELLAMLDQIIGEIGEPSGPTRAVARLIADEWKSANQNPQLTSWLLDQSVQAERDDPR